MQWHPAGCCLIPHVKPAFNYFAVLGDLVMVVSELPTMQFVLLGMNDKMKKALGPLNDPKVKKLLAPHNYASSSLPQKVKVVIGDLEITGYRVRH